MPQNIYDDAEFFAGYSQLPRSVEGLNGAPEWPSLRALLPPLNGARVVDLGCGFGWFSRYARDAGATRVLAVDVSENMLARARAATSDSAITYMHSPIEEMDLPAACCNLVYSSLALHYLPDFDAVCGMASRALVAGGSFVFSVEHPLYTAPSNPDWIARTSNQQVWPLNQYLIEGQRVTDWLKPGVVKYHRTVSTYVNTLVRHGFRLRHLEEWGPTDEQLAAQPALMSERQRPTFMLVAAELSGSGPD